MADEDGARALLRGLFRRGRSTLERAAETGRAQLQRRQLQQDLDHFWVRMGQTASRLVASGEIDHPALRQVMARIAELEARLDGLASGADEVDRDR